MVPGTNFVSRQGPVRETISGTLSLDRAIAS